MSKPTLTASLLRASLLVVGVLLAGPDSALGQSFGLRNGPTIQVQNGATLDLEGQTMDFGPVGGTARLEEQSGGRVTGGTLTATRALSNPSSADPAGLGLQISASADLGDVTVTRGHAVQTAPNGNESIERYYGVSPSQNNGGLSAELTFTYNDEELNGRDETTLAFFKSDDGGSNWSEEGFDSRSASNNTVTLGGIESLSRWTLGSEGNPLPVELAAFEGTVDERGVKLTWETASETNNAGFEVQRRRADGLEEGTWAKVGFVDGTGTTSEPQGYEFTDDNLPYAADSPSYRLRQVDVDGTGHTSEPILIDRTVDEVELLGPYPNPARTRATVRFATPGKQKVTLRLYDVMGRRVQTVVSSPKEGRTKMQIGLSDLSSGIYFLRLVAGDDTRTQRLTVVR